MKPAHKIVALHESPGVDLAEAMEAHLLLGYVTSTPDAMALARRIRPDADTGNPWDVDPNATTLYVWCASGDLDALADFLRSIPNCNAVAYHRRGRLICRRTTHFLYAISRRRCCQGSRTIPETVRPAIPRPDETHGAPTQSPEGPPNASAGAHGTCCHASEF
jgi:hypothetical protein